MSSGSEGWFSEDDFNTMLDNKEAYAHIYAEMEPAKAKLASMAGMKTWAVPEDNGEWVGDSWADPEEESTENKVVDEGWGSAWKSVREASAAAEIDVEEVLRSEDEDEFEEDDDIDNEIVFVAATRVDAAEPTAGFGIFFCDMDARNRSYRVDGIEQDQERAELMAVMEALSFADGEADKITIRSSSNFVKECVEEKYEAWWAKQWVNEDGTAVKNKDVIIDVRTEMSRRQFDLQQEVVFEIDSETENVYGLQQAAKLSREGLKKTALPFVPRNEGWAPKIATPATSDEEEYIPDDFDDHVWL